MLGISQGDAAAVLREARGLRAAGVPIPADVMEGVQLANSRRSSSGGAGESFVSEHYEGVGAGEVLDYVRRRALDHRVVSAAGKEEVAVKTCPSCPPHRGLAENLFKLYVSKSFCSSNPSRLYTVTDQNASTGTSRNVIRYRPDCRGVVLTT